MKLTFLKPATGAPFYLAYAEGDTADIADETAIQLVEKKYAIPAIEKVKTPAGEHHTADKATDQKKKETR